MFNIYTRRGALLFSATAMAGLLSPLPGYTVNSGQQAEEGARTDYVIIERPAAPGGKQVILQSGSGDILLLPTQQNVEDGVAGLSGLATRERPRVALALGGGGVRGAAHIGVLKVFEQEHIPIDIIVGTSMGAIIGGLYAARVPLNVIEEVAVSGDLRKAYAPGPVSGHVLAKIFQRIAHPIHSQNPPGVYSGYKFQEFLQELIPLQYQYIENLPVPFSAVSLDLMKGKICRITSGPLAEAIRASSSLPPAVRPLERDNEMLVDGGLVANLPTFTAKQLGADVVITVDVDEYIRPAERETLYKAKFFANRTAGLTMDALDEKARNMSDLNIWPDLGNIAILSRKRRDMQKAIQIGEEEARRNIAQIRRVISGEYLSEKSLSANREAR